MDDRTDGAIDAGPPPGPEVDRVLRRRLRVVAVATAALWTAVVVLWDEGPFAVTFDDAFYYFEIASRLADGQGSTFDGIGDTNGYHPLWMAICTVPYLLGASGMGAVRILLGLQAVLYGATLWVLADLIARAAGTWPRLVAERAARADACRWAVVTAVALAAANPFVVRTSVSGLESILVVGVGAVLLDRAHRGPGTLLADRTTRQRAVTAVLLVLAFLARTDAVLLLATVGVAGLAEVRTRQMGRRGVVALAALLAPAAIVVVVYLAANVAAFGGPQISGVVKRAPLDAASVGAFGLVALGCVVAIVRSGTRARRLEGGTRPSFGRASVYTSRTSWYGAFAVLTVAYYSFLSVQQWLWYYAPAVVWLLGLLAVTVADAAEHAARDAAPERTAARSVLPIGLLFGLPLAALLVFQVRALIDPELRSIQLANRAAGEWASRELPADAVLASWDAGVIGYFATQPVVNLDGVVNSFDWYDATQLGGPAMAAELDAAGVTHLVNHGAIVDGEDPDIRPYVEALWGPETADRVPFVESFPFVYSGTTVSAGGRSTGTRELAVWVSELPPPPR